MHSIHFIPREQICRPIGQRHKSRKANGSGHIGVGRATSLDQHQCADKCANRANAARGGKHSGEQGQRRGGTCRKMDLRNRTRILKFEHFLNQKIDSKYNAKAI